MELTFPDNTEVVDAIRDAVGREVEFFYIYSSYPCPNPQDSLNPVTNLSTNTFCPICSGLYWIPMYDSYETLAHITWGGYNQTEWLTGGQIFRGDCRIQVKYTQAILDVLKKTEYIIVDGVEMLIDKKMMRGTPQINRILLDLIERK